MPNFVSNTTGNLYSQDGKSALSKREEDELLGVISSEQTSNQVGHRDGGVKKPSAINKKGTREKHKSSLDLFKEELRRLNEERDQQRNKVQNNLTASLAKPGSSSSTTTASIQHNVPIPLKPDPRCPTTLTLQVNLNPSRDKDGPSTGSFDTGDPTTTNLYVGNLNPIVTEVDLCDIFGKFGPLASIKIMWPRTEEERARNRNSGFVAYMSRVDADRALKTLNGLEFKSYEMKLGWGKAVPLPRDPVFVPSALQDLLKPPEPSGMPLNAQPHRTDIERGYRVPKPHPRPHVGLVESESESNSYREFIEVLERSVVRVQVPKDRAMLDRIHKTIEYCLREGPVFEAIVIARETNNPDYKFLFDHQSGEHIYYRWKLYSLLHGEDPHRWQTEQFKMFEGGPWWSPPPINPYANGMPIELVEQLTAIPREILVNGRPAGDVSKRLEISSEPLGGESSTSSGNIGLKIRGKFDETMVKIFEAMLARLSPTKASIGDAMLFCINHSEAAEQIIGQIHRAVCQDSSSSVENKISLLFLISDILNNSSASVTNASFYRRGFQDKMLDIFKSLLAYLQTLIVSDEGRASKFKDQIMSVLGSWNYFHIFESKFLLELSDIILESPGRKNNASCDDVVSQSDTALAEDDTLMDGEPIDEETLAACLDERGLSLRWYTTLELSDADDDDAAGAAADGDDDDDEIGGSVASLPDKSLKPPDADQHKSSGEMDRVKFKASKWEEVNQEEEVVNKSPTTRIDPIRPMSTSEALKQQLQKQQEVVSSADEYESLGSSSSSSSSSSSPSPVCTGSNK